MTTDITELAQSLKAAAEKASNGDWVKESGDGWEACCSSNDQANGGFIIAHFVGPDAAENREFVQAANPANVLALVEALEKALRYIEELREWNAGLAQESCERQQRISELLEGKVGNALLERENHHVELVGKLAERIAELESRTVKLPPCVDDLHGIGMVMPADAVIEMLAAAGIKVEAE
ncbi:TPA: ead/Ea22-like family protein [Klebsiella quasipneumoniae subsp. quasipneumoniae]|nr:ead/Ea22-like family protein [Klebsiella quasipneumoniae subsp. quasipneumoniae]